MRPRSKILMIAILALLGGGTAGGLLWHRAARRTPPPQQAPAKPPSCTVALDTGTGELLLTNIGEAHWKLAVVYLDAEYPFGYRVELPAPKRGWRANIPLDKFRTQSGRAWPAGRMPKLIAVGGDDFGWLILDAAKDLEAQLGGGAGGKGSQGN